jgi:hypothetical protein
MRINTASTSTSTYTRICVHRHDECFNRCMPAMLNAIVYACHAGCNSVCMLCNGLKGCDTSRKQFLWCNVMMKRGSCCCHDIPIPQGLQASQSCNTTWYLWSNTRKPQHLSGEAQAVNRWSGASSPPTVITMMVVPPLTEKHRCLSVSAA